MLYGNLISLDTWRNYVPFAPDLTVTAYTGQPFTVDLSEWRLQGARDPEDYTSPDPEVMSRMAVQRGWRMRPILTEQPAHGTATTDLVNTSIIYQSIPGYLGQDCFTYVLSNGTQRSLMAQVLIDVIRWYGAEFTNLTYDQQSETYSVNLHEYTPVGEPDPLFTRYFWYWEDYKYAKNEDGRTKIFSQDKLLQQTQFASGTFSGNYPRVTDPANSYSGFVVENDSAMQGYEGESLVPYRPTGKPYTLKLVQRLYFHHRVRRVLAGYRNGAPYYRYVNDGLDYNRYTDYTFRITQDYGTKWWESGNIIYV